MSFNQNIFLIGMMGSWKSTVGKELSNELDLEFIDTDDEIEDATGESISEIFSNKGESQFREMESAFFVEKSKQKGLVISTGGGIVVTEANRLALQKNGITFFLQASPETLSNRIKDTNKRPLLHDEEPILKLSQIWKVRKDFYMESSHHIIETDRDNPQQVTQKILSILNR